MLALEPRRGLVVLDEIQRRPELFPALRVLADRRPRRARFLVLGSASPDLLRQTSRVAGRAYRVYDLIRVLARRSRSSAESIGSGSADGFPRSFLARSEAASREWRREFVRTYLERDVPQLGIAIPRRHAAPRLDHGRRTITASCGTPRSSRRAFGVADTTVRRYLDALHRDLRRATAAAVAREREKRQVKAPKLYVADSGLLHALLDIETEVDLHRHPKVGASWEGFAMAQVIHWLDARPEQCFFWRTHTGAELDLLIVRDRERLGFEFKRSSAPTITPSMRSALQDLELRGWMSCTPDPTRSDGAPRARRGARAAARRCEAGSRTSMTPFQLR